MKKIKHYQVKAKLGSGGMGEVHEALDTVLERKVAIKIIHGHLLQDPKMAERLLTEARAAAKLVHPNVVTVYEVGESEQGRYIAMEYADGVPLSEYLKLDAEMEPDTAIKLIRQVLSGLQCAHELGIIHRDIKPDNILVQENKSVKILDFGIAKIRSKEGLTVAGDILGTVEYMAPEQMLGEKVDVGSDVYAAGVVLYQLLTKELPFTGDSPVAILYSVLNEDPPPPSQYNHAVGDELDQVVLRAISKTKADRWASAEAFADALETILRSGTYPRVALPIEGADDVEDLEDQSPEVEGEPARLRPAFVGRDKEFKRLLHPFSQAGAGHGHTVILRGESGVGKSTLLGRLQKYAERKGARVLYGACLYQDGMDAYLPFIDAVRGFFNEENPSASDSDLADMKSFVRENIPVLSECTGDFSTHFEERPNRHESEASDKDSMFEAMHKFVSMLAHTETVVLAIDDLHWADQATLRLFHYLSQRITKQRVLLVGISRTDRYDLQKEGKPTMTVEILTRLRSEGQAEEITLYKLSQESCEQLIDKALSSTLFTEEFYDAIYAETGGNPLFILETLKLLRDQGSIFFKEGAWYNKQDSLDLSVPNRVEDVFMRRLSAVNEEEREILQVAAVCGYKFDPSLLARILEIPKIKLLKQFQKMERELQIVMSDELGFQFEHPMLRDLLYEEIPGSLRREYHLLIAADMEEQYQGNYGALVGEIGQHFRRGGNHVKAAPLLYRAGERTFGLKAFREAGLFFLDFIDSEQRSGESHLDPYSRSYFYLQLGRCHEETGRWQDSIQAYEQLRETTKQLDDLSGQVHALKSMGRIEAKSGNARKALKIYEKCLAMAEEEGVPEALAELYNNLGIIHFEMAELDQAQAYFERTLEAGDNDKVQEIKANTLMNLGILANMRSEYDTALDYYHRALPLFQATENRKGQARIYHNMGLTHADRGDWAESVAVYETCLELADDLQDKQLRSLIRLNLARVFVHQGELAKAEEYAKRALRIFKLASDMLNVAEAYHVFGMIHGAKGNLSEAELFLNQSINLNTQKEYEGGLAETYVTYGNLCRNQGDPERAKEYYQKAQALFDNMNLQAKVAEVSTLIDGI